MLRINNVSWIKRVKATIIVFTLIILFFAAQMLVCLASVGCGAGETGEYLAFLKNYSEDKWHSFWLQLWNLSPSVRVSSDIVDVYGSEQAAANKVIEHIATYAFWVDDTSTQGQYKYRSDRFGIVISGISYYQEAQEMQASIDTALKELLNAFDVSANELSKAAAIDLFLRDTVVYSDEGLTRGQTIYSTMVEKQALCGGYARTFQTIALLLGIDSHIVTGYLENNQGENIRHAWNIIEVGDTEYFIDSTVNATSATDWAVNQSIEDMSSMGYSVPTQHAEWIRSPKCTTVMHKGYMQKEGDWRGY